jgi:hypothetical protein
VALAQQRAQEHIENAENILLASIAKKYDK